jgi:hypothetical protein
MQIKGGDSSKRDEIITNILNDPQIEKHVSIMKNVQLLRTTTNIPPYITDRGSIGMLI